MRGEQAIRRDIIVTRYGLSDRQAQAIGHILDHGFLAIKEFEGLCPNLNRRSLQRNIKDMVNRGLLVSEGGTHKQHYRLAKLID